MQSGSERAYLGSSELQRVKMLSASTRNMR